MKGYIISTTKNTNDWVIYENDISTDYQEFLKGRFFPEKELPLFFSISKKSNLNKVKSALILESSGPKLVNKLLKEVLEANTNTLQFFDVELYCENEKIEGFFCIKCPN